MKDKLLFKNVQSKIKHAILFLKKKFLGLNKSFYVKNYLSLQIIVTRIIFKFDMMFDSSFNTTGDIVYIVCINHSFRMKKLWLSPQSGSRLHVSCCIAVTHWQPLYLTKAKKMKTHAQDSETCQNTSVGSTTKSSLSYIFGLLELKLTPFFVATVSTTFFILRKIENWRPYVYITLPIKTQIVFSILLIKIKINRKHLARISI